jgi:hypothetical protein
MVQTIAGLPGYDEVMSERVRLWHTPPRKTEAFVGLFKGTTDYVIARYDLVNGEPSRAIGVLLRSRSPIASIDYLPAPDTPEGRLGIVQRAGHDEAWLSMYDWHYGDLQPVS